MKILVTGGTVFVSRYIAEYFAARGNEVYVLNRNTKPQSAGVNLIACDRADIGRKLRNLRFDAVLDVTAYKSDDINNLLDALEHFDSYVMISTSAVYPDTLRMPYKETDECGFNRFWRDYGMNKIAAEFALMKRVPNAYILRPCYIYGEYNNLYREGFVFDCAQNGGPFYMPGDGSMPLQFIHVEDICRLIEIILSKNPVQRIYNVGNGAITVREWVEACYRVLGKTPEFVPVEGDFKQHKYFPFMDYGYVLDIERQNGLLNGLIPLDEGLKRSYGWFKDHRDLVRYKPYAEFIRENIIKS